jgi:hypothetical protein
MKRFLLASAFVLVLGLGTSTKAHAQLVYGYTLPAFGGIEQSRTSLSSLGTQSSLNFFSPLTGTMTENTGNLNTLFGKGSFSSFNSPYTGMVSQSKGAIATPFGINAYSTYYSPFTGTVASSRLLPSNTSNANVASFLSGFSPFTNTTQSLGLERQLFNAAGFGGGTSHHHR